VGLDPGRLRAVNHNETRKEVISVNVESPKAPIEPQMLGLKGA
jgi:hypothetical protein